MSNIYYGSRRPGVSGHKLYFRATGTSTPQNTYQDIELTTPHANPVVCESDGYFPVIYLDPTLPDYRVIHTDGSNEDDDPTLEVQIEPTLDDVPSSSKQAVEYRVKGTQPTIIFEETDASTNNKKWRIRVNNEQMIVATGDDAEAGWSSVLTITRTGVVAAGGYGIATNNSGSFTGTLTGVGSVVTGTCYFTVTGFMVALFIPAMSGTSDATTCTLTGLDPNIQPATASVALRAAHFTDNGAYAFDVCALITGTTITFTKNGSASGFTGSGTKGIPTGGITLVYSV